MRNTRQMKPLIVILFAALSLAILSTSFLTTTGTFAKSAGGPPNWTPTATPVPIPPISHFPNNGVSVHVVITTRGSDFELTPYLLSIPADARGIMWINQTDQDQIILSDEGIYAPLWVYAHQSQRLDLPRIGTYHFHLKSKQPVFFTVTKADPAPAQ